jgi:hypothetical protein
MVPLNLKSGLNGSDVSRLTVFAIIVYVTGNRRTLSSLMFGG